MKLYTLPPSPNSYKVVAVIHHLGLQVDIVPVDMAAGANKTPEFLKKNPNGLMPTLEDGDFCLWESDAIMRFLARDSDLYPAEAKQRALVEQWLCWNAAHWGPALRPFMYERIMKPMFRGEQPDQAALEAALEPFHQLAAVLDAALAGKSFLLGDSPTIADFALAAPMGWAAPAGFPLEKYTNYQAMYQRVLGMDCFKKAIPPMPAGVGH
jgi:glutathione S-transferase